MELIGDILNEACDTCKKVSIDNLTPELLMGFVDRMVVVMKEGCEANRALPDSDLRGAAIGVLQSRLLDVDWS